MADLDAAFEKFTAPAVAHSGTGATVILTIPVKTSRQYELLITGKVQDDDAVLERVGFVAEIEIARAGGSIFATLQVMSTNDPNAAGYTIDRNISGTDVQIRITGLAASVSSVKAIGVSFEQIISES